MSKERQLLAIFGLLSFVTLGATVAPSGQPCSSFHFDECMNSCDQKVGISNPLNLQCIGLCRQSKDNCAAGRAPVDNPYLSDGKASPGPNTEKEVPQAHPSGPSPTDRPEIPLVRPSGKSGRDYRTYDNRDIDGEDIRTLKNIDLQSCIFACSGEPRCQAYSFDKWNRYCFLKSTMTALRLDPRSTAGIRQGLSVPPTASAFIQMERYRGKMFPGAGYRTLSHSQFEACETACQRDQTCVAYTFQKNERNCHLFDGTGEYFPTTQADSGIKRQAR